VVERVQVENRVFVLATSKEEAEEKLFEAIRDNIDIGDALDLKESSRSIKHSEVLEVESIN